MQTAPMNERENRKKREELIFLENFLKIAEPEAEIIETDRESPDFILRQNGRLIGVEVTKIFISNEKGPNTLQARESKASQIISRAQQYYQSSGEPSVSVNIVFHPGYDLTKVLVDSTASLLASFVKDLKLADGQSVSWKPEEAVSPLPDEISYVQVRRVPEASMAHWGMAGAGWVASLSASILQERIDAKKKLLPNYLKEVDEHWLLMVANKTKPSQMLKTPDGLDDFKVQSPFSRTFFYPYPENRIYEL